MLSHQGFLLIEQEPQEILINIIEILGIIGILWVLKPLY